LRRAIFRDGASYRKFEELLAMLRERFGVRLHTYVLMPNHYHLQIETPLLDFRKAIRWLNIFYAVWFDRKRGGNGPLWQGRGTRSERSRQHRKRFQTWMNKEIPTSKQQRVMSVPQKRSSLYFVNRKRRRFVAIALSASIPMRPQLIW
jgi:REP element-mobilizing transposase RayT